MSYKVDTIAPFRKEAKKLIKKYPSLKNELALLGSQLSENPMKGTSLGNNCYKIRLVISSKGKGKAGGARVITHFLYIRPYRISNLHIRQVGSQKHFSQPS